MEILKPLILGAAGWLLGVTDLSWLRGILPNILKWGDALTQILEYGTNIVGFVCLIITMSILLIRRDKDKVDLELARKELNKEDDKADYS